MARKPMSSGLLAVIVVASVFLGFCGAFGGFLWIVAKTSPMPLASEATISVGGIATDGSLTVEMSDKYEEVTGYYDTPAEAYLHSGFHREGRYELVSDELMRFEDEDRVTALFFGRLPSGNVHIVFVCCNKGRDMVSNPVYASVVGLTPEWRDVPIRHQFDERSAATQFIVDSLLRADSFLRATDGQWVTIGTSRSEAVYTMTILGKRPTEVRRVQYEGEAYYIWYYLGDAIPDAILEDGHLKEGIATLGDIADTLDIRVAEG